MNLHYNINPLGDSALIIDYGNRISETTNTQVISRFNQLQQNPIHGVTELIPAYSSLTICYDPVLLYKKIDRTSTVFEWVKSEIEKKLTEALPATIAESRLVKIPVCYDEEFATDTKYICEKNNLSSEELIKIHTSTTYKIYMMGFLPGFAYMGEVDERIAVPRKQQPVKMIAGSVGIAGRQTGIYPLDSPGGWQIIGRTPWKLFDAGKDEPVLLQAGDKVQFYKIDKETFDHESASH